MSKSELYTTQFEQVVCNGISAVQLSSMHLSRAYNIHKLFVNVSLGIVIYCACAHDLFSGTLEATNATYTLVP